MKRSWGDYARVERVLRTEMGLRRCRIWGLEFPASEAGGAACWREVLAPIRLTRPLPSKVLESPLGFSMSPAPELWSEGARMGKG